MFLFEERERYILRPTSSNNAEAPRVGTMGCLFAAVFSFFSLAAEMCGFFFFLFPFLFTMDDSKEWIKIIFSFHFVLKIELISNFRPQMLSSSYYFNCNVRANLLTV